MAVGTGTSTTVEIRGDASSLKNEIDASLKALKQLGSTIDTTNKDAVAGFREAAAAEKEWLQGINANEQQMRNLDAAVRSFDSHVGMSGRSINRFAQTGTRGLYMMTAQSDIFGRGLVTIASAAGQAAFMMGVPFAGAVAILALGIGRLYENWEKDDAKIVAKLNKEVEAVLKVGDAMKDVQESQKIGTQLTKDENELYALQLQRAQYLDILGNVSIYKTERRISQLKTLIAGEQGAADAAREGAHAQALATKGDDLRSAALKEQRLLVEESKLLEDARAAGLTGETQKIQANIAAHKARFDALVAQGQSLTAQGGDQGKQFGDMQGDLQDQIHGGDEPARIREQIEQAKKDAAKLKETQKAEWAIIAKAIDGGRESLVRFDEEQSKNLGEQNDRGITNAARQAEIVSETNKLLAERRTLVNGALQPEDKFTAALADAEDTLNKQIATENEAYQKLVESGKATEADRKAHQQIVDLLKQEYAVRIQNAKATADADAAAERARKAQQERLALEEKFGGALSRTASMLGEMSRGHQNQAQMVKKIVGEQASAWGQFFIKRGMADIASALVPGNQASLAGGIAEVAAGTALTALGGAESGGGGGSGGGGPAGGSFSRSGQSDGRSDNTLGARNSSSRNSPQVIEVVLTQKDMSGKQLAQSRQQLQRLDDRNAPVRVTL